MSDEKMITNVSISLDAKEGDSVLSHAANMQKEKLNLGPDSLGILIPEFDVKSFRMMNLYCQTKQEINGVIQLHLEISPIESGDVWYVTLAKIQPSKSLGVVVAGNPFPVVACRARISTSGSINSGMYDLYVVGQS